MHNGSMEAYATELQPLRAQFTNLEINMAPEATSTGPSCSVEVPLQVPARGLCQCSRLKASMPFKCNLALQNVPLKTTLPNATPN